jgi:hypothetical protein
MALKIGWVIHINRLTTLSGVKLAPYVPIGSLAKTPGGTFDRSFTNLLGVTFTVTDGYAVNGNSISSFHSYFVANGTQIRPFSKVLLPSAP